jgi:hypothetical protein
MILGGKIYKSKIAAKVPIRDKSVSQAQAIHDQEVAALDSLPEVRPSRLARLKALLA